MLERSFAVVLLLTACSPGAAPVSRSTTDPASPNAPEGMNPALALARPQAPPPAPAPAPAHEHSGANEHAGHDHAATVYACPMHPEVTSDKPDQTCPKCNMKLVPRP